MMRKRYIRLGAIAVCLAIIVYELVRIIIDQTQYRAAQLEYESIKNEYAGYAGNEAVSGYAIFEPIDYPHLSVAFDDLYGKNEDYTGWIYMPCLDISYPVVKETEINEYLYKTFDGKNNRAGCLFEDVLSDDKFCGRHDMIFGHNMKDKSMFGNLKNLNGSAGEILLADNPYVYIYTKDKVYQYEIFAYYVTSKGSAAYAEVETDDDYDSLFTYINSQSACDMPSDISEYVGNRASILTLSTCYGSAGTSRRFVVHTIKKNCWDV